jgi:hypothetical protein
MHDFAWFTSKRNSKIWSENEWEISEIERKNRSETKMNRKIACLRENLKRKRTVNKQNEAKKSKRNEIEPNFLWRGNFSVFSFNVRYSTPLHLSPLRVPLYRMMLGSNPGQLRLWHWQPDALTTWLELINMANSHPLARSIHKVRSHPRG